MSAEETLVRCGVLVGAVLMLSAEEIQAAADTPHLRPLYREQILALKKLRIELQETFRSNWGQ
jgi:hypothetical protein